MFFFSLACSGLQLLWLSRYFSDLPVDNKIEVNGHSFPAPQDQWFPSLLGAVCTPNPDSAFLLLPLIFLTLILVAFSAVLQAQGFSTCFQLCLYPAGD